MLVLLSSPTPTFPPRIVKPTPLHKRQVPREMQRLSQAITKKRHWDMPNLLHLAWNTDGTRMLPTIHLSICLKVPMLPCKSISLKFHKSVLYLNQRSLERNDCTFSFLHCHNMICKKHTDKIMMYPKREKKDRLNDRFACIIPKRGGESFSSHYLLSRSTLATKIAVCQRIQPTGGRWYHTPRHKFIKSWLLRVHQRLKVSLQPHILRSTW